MKRQKQPQSPKSSQASLDLRSDPGPSSTPPPAIPHVDIHRTPDYSSVDQVIEVEEQHDNTSKGKRHAEQETYRQALNREIEERAPVQQASGGGVSKNPVPEGSGGRSKEFLHFQDYFGREHTFTFALVQTWQVRTIPQLTLSHNRSSDLNTGNGEGDHFRFRPL